jgi:aspartyl-tRNA(Asn)/glutamyl-tRNA(Gln) amidotransferase subunit C
MPEARIARQRGHADVWPPDFARCGCYDLAIMSDHRIDLEQVRHVARLARLDLSADEERSLAADLSAIVSYVDKLGQLDTQNIEPTAQVTEAGTPLRDDVVTNEPAPEAMLANAPARQGNLFVVPKIIE